MGYMQVNDMHTSQEKSNIFTDWDQWGQWYSIRI